MARSPERQQQQQQTKPASSSFEDRGLAAATTRQELIALRLAEVLAQKDWRLLEAGRSLHDDIGQLLTAAGIRCDLLAGQLASLAPELVEESQTLQELLEQCLQRVRALSSELNRATADRLGMRSAIERLVERWECGVRAPIHFQCPDGLKLALGPARIAARLAEFGIELGANRLHCSKVNIKVRSTTKKCHMTVEIWGVNDPFKEIETEAGWRILRASAALAGSEVTLGVAFKSEDVTIMKGEFPT